MLKPSISGPYNFQHLTHTGAHHAKSLQNASQNDLITEFSAIRASQAPLTKLRGIKAERLELKNRSGGSQAVSPTGSLEDLTSSASLSPVKSRDDWTNMSLSEEKPFRHSPSTDSFKRISSRSFSSLTPPVSPPPRRSSRTPLPFSYDQSAGGQETCIIPFSNMANDASTNSLRSNTPSPSANTALLTNPFDQVDPSNVGHAITTPDDTAFSLRPLQLSSSSTALADVPEEDEGHHPGQHAPSGNSRPSTSNSAIRHTKSFPSVSSSPKKGRSPMSVPLPASSGRITASDPTLPLSDLQTEEIPRRTSRLVSTSFNYMTESWEDDIDYCYEHEAEADCAFDWYQISQEDDKASSATEVIDEIFDSAASSFEQITYNSNYSSLVIEDPNTSSLQCSRPSSYIQTPVDHVHSSNRDSTTLPSHSSFSSAATIPGALTPFDSSISSPRVFDLSARSSHASLVLPLSPSSSIPHEYQPHFVEDKDTLDKPLTGGSIRQQFPFSAHEIDISLHHGNSLRNSEPPLSTSHSQESMLQMHASSADARHRTDGSLSSLPELVPSRTSRERFDLETEDLVNQINALIHNKPLSRVVRVTPLRKATSTMSIAEKVHEDVSSAVTSPLNRSRDRSLSASEDRVLPAASDADNIDNGFTGRTRSISAATTLTRKKSGRTSYSLFPSVPSR